MGVPGFFAWLMRQRGGKRILKDNIASGPVKQFYIDSNCLFHPQCFNLLKHMPAEKNVGKLEKKMIQRILNYMDYIIEYVDPTDLVYISVDGVAPLAKINQQRKRRFRAVDDLRIRNTIKRKHNVEINDIWSNTAITPGTEFMELLHAAIDMHIQERQKKERDNNKTQRKYIYSSYHTAGEGEHKILQHMKTDKSNDNIVVYGLDADLFFLSMASQKQNIYLLRESREIDRNVPESNVIDPVTDVVEPLTYASIDETIECATNILKHTITQKMRAQKLDNDMKLDDDMIRNDFVFMCYLLGNDFLPHFPSIDVKKKGLDIIIDVYSDIIIDNRAYLFNNDGAINQDILMNLISNLAKLEYEYFTITLPKETKRFSKFKCEEQDPYLRDLWRLEHMKLFKVVDDIRLGEGNEEEWKQRYYDHYFGHYVTETNTLNDVIDQLCKEYIEGLVWVTKYYFDECPDYKWQYTHTHAPFLSDLARYADKMRESFNINDIKFVKRPVFEPMQQLLAVLHPKSRSLLPTSYRYLVHAADSPILDMFPEKLQLDMINKDLFWQCIPMIESVEPDRIIEATKGLKLSKDEKKRNRVDPDLIY